MKVTLNNFEIQEAVQCYISNILGSDLKVTEISVVQGREQGGSNTSRIELELVKADTTAKCSKVSANACNEISPVDVPVLPEPIEKTIEEVQEDTVPAEEPKAETAKPLSEPVVEQTVNASFFNRAN